MPTGIQSSLRNIKVTHSSNTTPKMCSCPGLMHQAQKTGVDVSGQPGQSRDPDTAHAVAGLRAFPGGNPESSLVHTAKVDPSNKKLPVSRH